MAGTPTAQEDNAEQPDRATLMGENNAVRRAPFVAVSPAATSSGIDLTTTVKDAIPRHKTTGDVWSFSYDHLNRLVAATLRNSLNQVSKDARYAYDVFGQRIEKKVDGDGNGTFEQVSRSAYLDGMAFADFDGATTLTTRYFAGDHIDELLARISASGTVAWYLPDNLGSVRHIVDNTGSTIATLSYDSFGKLTSAEDADSDRFRFTGREYDAETGLYYYRARYYDPNTGRFLEQDPIGFAAGDANLYRYVGNGPTNGTDPSGLDELQPLWDFVAGIFVPPPPGYSTPADLGATVPVRIGGGVQTIGGAGQVLIGGGLLLAPDSTVMSKLGGGIIAGKGVDNMNAGIAAMLSGKPQKTATAQTFGDGTDFALDLLGPTAAGLRSWMQHRPPCPAAGPVAPRTIAHIGDLTAQEQAALARAWQGGPRSALPLEVREALAAHYRRVGTSAANPAGSAQRAFQEARARYLLGEGPNPGPNVHEFSRQTGIPIFRRGGGE